MYYLCYVSKIYRYRCVYRPTVSVIFSSSSHLDGGISRAADSSSSLALFVRRDCYFSSKKEKEEMHPLDFEKKPERPIPV